MRLPVKNVRGQVVRSVQVRDDVFGLRANPALVHQVIVGQLANLRQGTSATKSRGLVSGGGRKPRAQKHTGFSRAGSIRDPHWRGGGVVFGPRPRNYRVRTPKRMRRQAALSVLSDKVREGHLIVMDDLVLGQNKTKEMAQMLRDVGAGVSVLLVADGANSDAVACVGNLPRVKAIPSSHINSLDMLKHQSVVMTLEAVEKIESLWGGTLRKGKRPVVRPMSSVGDAA